MTRAVLILLAFLAILAVGVFVVISSSDTPTAPSISDTVPAQSGDGFGDIK